MATYLETNETGNREDLWDVLVNISPEKTPFQTLIKDNARTAKGVYHEWSFDVLAAADGDNAAVEGADASSATLVAPTRVGNYTQIFEKTVQVSGTQETVVTAGKKSEMAYQIAKGMSELKRDIEHSISQNNASVAGSTRKSAGAESWLTTNATRSTDGSPAGADGGFSSGIVAAPTDDSSTVSLTEAMYKTNIQNIWTEGGDATHTLCAGGQKVNISAFTGSATKYHEMKDQTVFQGVDIYVSDFGTHTIIPSQFMRSSTVLNIDPDYWALATLRPMVKNELSSTGDSEKVQLLSELTLVCMNEAASGSISDLS